MAKRRRCGLLPKVVLIQILARVPVKTLLRFKSINKSWFTLIESSSFIDLHTTTFNYSSSSSSSSSSSNKFGTFILLASLGKPSPLSYKNPTENSLMMLSPESESESNDDDQQQQLVFQLDNLGVVPCYKESLMYFKGIIGSCNGLVCLYDRDVNRVSLWNPATKQHRNLPKPIEIAVARPSHLAAFGLDVETKDYKVVLLTGFPPMHYRPVSPIECVCRIQVYSLSTDSWRVVEGITCLPGDPFLYPCEVLYLNGSIFFMAHFFRTKHYQPCIPQNDSFIFSFDLTKEIITPIQLPDHHRDQKLFLSCWADKIALFIVKYQPRFRPYPPNGLFCDDYTIWALLDEHVSGSSSSSSNSVNKDSWTKLHSFQLTVERPSETNIPRGISNDGKFAFLEIHRATGGKNMKLYHFASKEVKRTFPSGGGSMMARANAYKPSLVSINGGNGAAIEETATGPEFPPAE